MEFIDNEFVIPGYVADLLNKIALENGLKNFTTTVTSDSDTKDGFMGVVFRFKLIDKKVTVNMIAKMLPLSKARREQTGLPNLFKREIIFYNEILPDFAKFQEEKNIKPEEGFFNFPKCYGSHYDEVTGDCIILLEDLTCMDYEMYDKLKPADLDHVKLLMEQLGKYHAISLAMKDQEPKRFKKCSSMKDNLFVSLFEHEPARIRFGQNFATAAETLEPFEEFNHEKMLKLKDDFYNCFKNYDDTTKIEPFAVLTHGDCKINNMMYQYDNTRTPVKICLIDWQISRYSSPVLDIAYFIFSATDKQLRAENYENLIKIYYKHLSQHLTRLGSDAEKLFTFKDLLDQLKKFGQFGLITASMALPLLTIKVEDNPNMDEIADKIDRGETFDDYRDAKEVNSAYKIRMSDVIRDVVRLGYY